MDKFEANTPGFSLSVFHAWVIALFDLKRTVQKQRSYICDHTSNKRSYILQGFSAVHSIYMHVPSRCFHFTSTATSMVCAFASFSFAWSVSSSTSAQIDTCTAVTLATRIGPGPRGVSHATSLARKKRWTQLCLCTMSVGHQFCQRHGVSHDSRLFLRMRRTLSILSASLALWRSWQNLAHFYRDPGGKYCKRLGPRFSRSRGASSLAVGGPREGLRVYLSRGHGGDLEKGG